MSTPELTPTDAEPADTGDVVDLPPPNLNTTRSRLVQLWRIRRHEKKRKKYLSKGYVQWYLIEDAFPRPKFVKPEKKGGGIRELKYDGERYLFPRDAFVPSKDKGMWTVVHRKGEADPINLNDPSRHSIPADELEEYLQLRVSSSPPSFLDKFDLDAQDILTYAIVGIIVLAILNGFIGGI